MVAGARNQRPHGVTKATVGNPCYAHFRTSALVAFRSLYSILVQILPFQDAFGPNSRGRAFFVLLSGILSGTDFSFLGGRALQLQSAKQLRVRGHDDS